MGEAGQGWVQLCQPGATGGTVKVQPGLWAPAWLCACLGLGPEPLGGHSSVAPLPGKGRAVGRWRLLLLLGCWSRAGGPRGVAWGPQLSAGGQRGLGRGRQGQGCHTIGLGDST